YAVYKNGTGFEAWEKWPEDIAECEMTALFFATDKNGWAVERKADSRMIGFVSFNEVKDRLLDFGHGFTHPLVEDATLKTEALEIMIQYAFDTLAIDAVDARNEKAWVENTAPLFALGFVELDDKMQMTRENWVARKNLETKNTTLESIRYIPLTASRFIGKTVIATGLPPHEAGQKYGEMWGRSGAFMPALDALFVEHGLAEISDPCALMHFNNLHFDEPDGFMRYVVGKFFKADTPVPDGFDHWDMPATTVALAIVRGEFEDMIGNAHKRTMEKLHTDGYEVIYPQNFFQAEVYVKENVPKEGVVSKLGFLFSVFKRQASNELFAEHAKPATPEELRAYAATREDPAKTANKIAGIRRLWHDMKSENFYLEGCLTAVMKAVGENPRYDYPFFLALCGGFFTQVYRHDDGPDCRTAGATTVFDPGLVGRVMDLCGYSCVYMDRATIQSHPALVMDVVKTAIDKGIPVISKGIGNAQIGGTFHEELAEWCNIGGYTKDGALLVNVYFENIPTDEHGYIEIKDGLSKSRGLFVLGEKKAGPEYGDILKRAFNDIPVFLTRPDKDGFSFGKKAFYAWADMLEDEKMEAEEAQGRDFASSVVYETIAYYFREHCAGLTRDIPDFGLAQKVHAAFQKMHRAPKPATKGYFSSREEMADMEFRRERAKWARGVGDLHDELAALFAEPRANNKTGNEEKASW
ncbi:MAG: hypothetical protein FWF96_03035, partial [Kiritimatiellaeota bacterium]|nr:hypothetical protein [Kiritimatiellota bacterium]